MLGSEARIPRVQLAALFLIVLVLGFLFAVQVQSQATAERYLRGQDNVTLGLLINGLAQSNERLIEARGELTREQERLAAAAAGSGSATAPVQEQLDKLRVFDGTAAVHGPGVQLAVGFRLSSQEVQDMANAMRQFGAEAMSINGHRMVSATVLRDKGNELAVDGSVVTAPYDIVVIGDPAQLANAASQIVASLRSHGAVSVRPQADLHITATVPRRQVVYSVYR